MVLSKNIKFVVTAVVFKTNRGYMTYRDTISLGTFKFSKDKLALQKKITILKSDLLKDDFDFNGIQKEKKEITKILMDQKKYGSGIGNYLCCEILYRAKISPYRLCNELSNKEVKDLVYWTKYCTKLAYQNNHVGNLLVNQNLIFLHNMQKYQLSLCLLYLLIPFILATKIFMIASTSLVNSSSGSKFSFLLTIIISPLE